MWIEEALETRILVQNLNVMNKKIPGEALSNIVEANMIKKKMETNKMN